MYAQSYDLLFKVSILPRHMKLQFYFNMLYTVCGKRIIPLFTNNNNTFDFKLIVEAIEEYSMSIKTS